MEDFVVSQAQNPTDSSPSDEVKSEGYSLQDWQQLYLEDDLKWDIGEVSPPLLKLWEAGNIPREGNVIIPGCGQGHEVMFFARNGMHTTGVDFAPGACERLSRRLEQEGLNARVVLASFFDLGTGHNLFYDLMFEQTFFCAIHPDQRSSYLETVCRVLKAGGVLAGVFYETGEDGGPPFNTTEDEIRKRFSEYFKISLLEKTQHSIERRKNKEWLGVFVKR